LSDVSRAGVTVTPHGLWRLDLGRQVARGALVAVVLVGVSATARFAIAPPHASVLRGPTPDLPDPGAEGFATLFARRYLTWDATNPQAHGQALQSLLGGDFDADAGLRAPPSQSQHVLWAQVVQTRVSAPREHVYTVAAQTDMSGLIYLAVRVRRGPLGLGLAAYPAFVGAPDVASAQDGTARLRDVSDSSLTQVVTRALRNYLAGSAADLEADLTADARVALPAVALTLGRVLQTRWSPDGASVRTTVMAGDGHGAQYTLTYELDVWRVGGRWEISAIQTDPDA